MKKGLMITQRIQSMKCEDEENIFNVQNNYDENVSDENEEDNEEEIIFVPLRKMVVKKEENEKEELFDEIKEEINEQSINQKLIDLTLKKEEENKMKEESSEDFSSGDEYGGKEEFEEWQQRELQRLKKEYIDNLNFNNDLAKLKEICSTQTQNELDEKKRERKKWKFMQKYYHIGSFFRDGGEWDVSKGNWDFDAATGDDWMDKSLLPQILQTRDWGKKGRSKHTTLKDDDTTYRKYD